MARKLKIMENEKHPLDDLINDEITKKREKWEMHTEGPGIWRLITKDFEHFFRCLSTVQQSSVVNSCFSFLPHFLLLFKILFICLFIHLFILVINFLTSLYILDVSSILDVGLVKIFSPICRLPICLINYLLCLTENFRFYKVTFIDSWS
jgi:hypothetical protein